jgi:hypothetical protein
VVLQNNAADNLSITADGAFTIGASVVTGTAYAVTVLTQPAGQTCTASNASGAVAAANVTAIAVSCANNPLVFLTSNPQSGSTENARDVPPTLTFDRALNDSTVAGAVSLSVPSGAEPGSATSSGAIVTITPTRKLLPMALYTMSVSTDLRGSNGELLASAVSADFATRDGIWQPSTALRAAPLPAGNTDGQASLVSDANGNATAVWPQFNGVRRNLVASRYEPATGWSTPELIEAENLGDAEGPQLAVDAAGNVTAVWRQFDGTRYNAWANRFTVTGATGSWGTPTPIESAAQTVSSVKVAANAGGSVTAVFGQTDGVRVNLWATRLSGGAWGPPAIVETNNTSDVTDFSVAADAQSNVIAVWLQNDGTRDNVWSNSATSGVWGTAELRETSDVGTAYPPKVAMDTTGTIVVAWSQDNGVNRETIANRYVSGSGWSGTRVLDPTGASTRQLALGFARDGRAFAIWMCDHTGARLCLSNFGMGGNAWSPLQSSSVLPTPSTNGGLRMTVDATGHVMATWTDQASHLNGGNPVYTPRPVAMRYLLSLGGWGAPEFLDVQESQSGAFGSDTRLQSVVEASGSVLVVWPTLDGRMMTKRFE